GAPRGLALEPRRAALPLDLFAHPARVGLGVARRARGGAAALVVADPGQQFQDDEVGPPSGHAVMICRSPVLYQRDMARCLLGDYRGTGAARRLGRQWHTD